MESLLDEVTSAGRLFELSGQQKQTPLCRGGREEPVVKQQMHTAGAMTVPEFFTWSG
jgi:hypothetical protein